MEISQNTFECSTIGSTSTTPSYFDPESENYLKELTRDELLEWLDISSSSDEGDSPLITKNEPEDSESSDNSDESDKSSSSSSSTDSDSNSESDTSEDEEQEKIRKVRFNLKPKIYLMRTWRVAHRLARKSYWEIVARDRYRFKRRINEIDSVVSIILNSIHREKIYNERFLNVHCIGSVDDDVEMLDLEKLKRLSIR